LRTKPKRGKEIRGLLKSGATCAEVVKKIGVKRSTVDYHAKKIGVSILVGHYRKYNWSDIQNDITGGMTVKEIREKHGFAVGSYTKAVNRGELNPKKPLVQMSLDELCALFDGLDVLPYHRQCIRKKMVSEGIPYECAWCGVSEWRGRKLTLDVDHVDGCRTHNVRTNFRFLCPNCHSITPTWKGRNKKIFS